MKLYFNITFICLLALLIGGCKDMYDLPDDVKNVKLLVVEGTLNSAGPTTIKLSRTVNLKDTTKIKPELNATVTVEGETSGNYPLAGNTKGEYTNLFLPLSNNQKYRLRIKVTGGKEYLSDLIPVINAPPIDSVSWQRKESGVETGIQIYVNTHDPQNDTKYYRWEYDETWEFNSPYYSQFEYLNNQVVPRPDPSKIFTCWKSEASNKILVGSSAKLSEDVISYAPLDIIQFTNIKITVRFSINVRQYALTKEGYEYWDIMKKNTEQLGTLFDPQPSNLFSNIHSLNDPNEEVIGFISAGSISEKRLFITRSEVEPWRYHHDCMDEVAVAPNDYKMFFGQKLLIPTRENYLFGMLAGYYGATPECVDCTLSGTNVRPSFW